MPYLFMANTLVVLHFAFVAFVIFGGLLVVRWRWMAWLHIPAWAWGVYVEFSGRICPLTPIEQRWRELGHGTTYSGTFVDHYIMPVLYPRGLTHDIQHVLGAGILVLNIVVYAIAYRESRRARGRAATFNSRGFEVLPDASRIPADEVPVTRRA